MNRKLWVLWVLVCLSGCFNQPVGFHLSEPAGYNYTTGNLRDIQNYERYEQGTTAVKITLRMVELSGSIYDPVFDADAFLEKIGYADATLVREPFIQTRSDYDVIMIEIQHSETHLTLWIINLDSPVDLWAEVRGESDAVIQAFDDWIDVWDSVEYLYF